MKTLYKSLKIPTNATMELNLLKIDKIRKKKIKLEVFEHCTYLTASTFTSLFLYVKFLSQYKHISIRHDSRMLWLLIQRYYR